MAGSTGNNKLGNNGGRFYSYGFQPVLIDCNFVVDSTNGNGLGIRSLKGEGVQNVFMNSSASFTGSTHSNTVIDSISPVTSSWAVVGMPIQGSGIPVGAKIASITSSTAITITAAATTSVGGGTITYQGVGSPNPAAGYALIQLANNYQKYLGGFSGFVSPLVNSNIAINATALTAGDPYVIVSVGHGTAGAVTIAPVDDVSGNLASTWFTLYDSYGNTFIIWFSVSGVGSAPNLGPAALPGTVGLHYVQQSISTNDVAATIGAALVITIENLPSGSAGQDSFTAAGTSTVTVTNTLNVPFPGGPADGAIPTGFTFAITKYKSNLQNWQNVGLPYGVTPSVGASFIATTTGDSTGGGSTGLVQAPAISGISTIEVIGDANQSIAPGPVGGTPHVGGWILVQLLASTSASVTTKIPTAPVDGSVLGMSFYVNART